MGQSANKQGVTTQGMTLEASRFACTNAYGRKLRARGVRPSKQQASQLLASPSSPMSQHTARSLPTWLHCPLLCP